ncbi:MAG: hypothetical protein O3A96_06465 [Proteobacteria bacterium]|nr:hypothetical protein [Pseudomonadota bacterium]
MTAPGVMGRPDPALMRPPKEVMRLARMGASFPTRLSFMRSLVRRLAREAWRFEVARFDLDEEGYGTVLLSAEGPERVYTLVGFSHALAPEKRTDRVIAEEWDATFSLFDGVPGEADIERLRANTPRQEAGRFMPSDLVLARANKSLRLFDHIADSLAAGRQPSIEQVASVGYLMRTTAVYGSGKFGCADREKLAGRPETRGAFQVELLTVYLIRWFTILLIEHVARKRGGGRAVALDPALRRHLGIGNATGLGMAPFLIKHPALTDAWVTARETALARVRGLTAASPETAAAFRRMLARARCHVGEWGVEDAEQTARIFVLRSEMAELEAWCESGGLAAAAPWDALYRFAANKFSLEGQEMTLALILEPHGPLIDDLADGMFAVEDGRLDPAMPVGRLRALIEERYDWALAIDFGKPEAQGRFWYYSEEKLEPRLGDRHRDAGGELEMPLAAGRDAAALHAALAGYDAAAPVADLLRARPDLRHAVRRVQAVADHAYAEIRDNLVDGAVRPIDLLRFKLAFFGAAKFDPKSDLWTRITMFQGAPLPEDLAAPGADDWAFPVAPATPTASAVVS